MQWLTPTKGTPSFKARALAAVPTIRKHGPKPGPCENAIPSIERGSVELRTSPITPITLLAKCWAASLGCIPPEVGIYAEFASNKTSSSLTRLALRFQAVPSRPRTIIPENEDHFLNCVYPHLPQDDLSLCSAKKTPSPQRGQFWRRLFALSPLTS